MRKILKGNLDCIGCPNYHVTKNGKVYSNYKGKGWVKLSLNRIKNNGYVIVSIGVLLRKILNNVLERVGLNFQIQS